MLDAVAKGMTLPHDSRGKWERFPFICELAGIGQASQNILSLKSRVVLEDFRLGHARSWQVNNELGREAGIHPRSNYRAGSTFSNNCVPLSR